VQTMQAPSSNHIEFDQLCAGVEEFEPLPTLSSNALEAEAESEENTSLNEQILAGLVSPV
jgi:hypothetical protein